MPTPRVAFLCGSGLVGPNAWWLVRFYVPGNGS